MRRTKHELLIINTKAGKKAWNKILIQHNFTTAKKICKNKF